MPQRQRYLFVCINSRADDHPKGSCTARGAEEVRLALKEQLATRGLAKIGKPTDPSEWDLTPATVNAEYDPQRNDINFPAGILQPPYFDLKGDDAENLGAIGLVIGHELTHGFRCYTSEPVVLLSSTRTE